MKIAINVTSSKYRHCWQWIPLSSFLVVLPQTPAHLSAFEILFWSDLKLTQPSHSWHLSHSVSWAPRRGLSPHTHPYTASTALRDELRFLCYIRGEFRECLQHQGYVAHLSPLGRHLCRIQWWGTERRQVLSEPCISWHIKKKKSCEIYCWSTNCLKSSEFTAPRRMRYYQVGWKRVLFLLLCYSSDFALPGEKIKFLLYRKCTSLWLKLSSSFPSNSA